MPTAIAMVITLTGIGCHNEDVGVALVQPACAACGAASACTGFVPPSIHPRADVASFGGSGHVERYPGGALRATLLSFFLGHDDVPTARDIEASFYAGQYSGQYGYMTTDVPTAASPSR
jgi:hypothetical protein